MRGLYVGVSVFEGAPKNCYCPFGVSSKPPKPGAHKKNTHPVFFKRVLCGNGFGLSKPLMPAFSMWAPSGHHNWMESSLELLSSILVTYIQGNKGSLRFTCTANLISTTVNLNGGVMKHLQPRSLRFLVRCPTSLSRILGMAIHAPTGLPKLQTKLRITRHSGSWMS